jgi:hypothetical protein
VIVTVPLEIVATVEGVAVAEVFEKLSTRERPVEISPPVLPPALV